MYEFDIYNKITGEEDMIFGYSFENALSRYGLNSNEWALGGSPHFID